MFSCLIKYKIDPNKIEAFKEYACLWMALIKKHGGIHHGYFLPGTENDNLPTTSFSFPNLGKSGPENVSVALFSFPNLETYEQYKKSVVEDEACKTATRIFNETQCFFSYERNFLKPMFK